MARKILLADDSVTAQNMGRRILTDAGYEVITVNNGSAALKKIAELSPDLIILDVYMPGYGGLEVCQRLKESQATTRIPVLLTVGKLEPFKAEEAKRVRADAHIIKPFDANELLAAIIKLEDRIVPQPATNKPGRFAKAVAAVEESSPRRHREKSSDSSGETTSGWKKRLSVPKSAPKTEEPEESKPRTANTAFHDLARKVDAKPEENLPEVPFTISAPEESMGVADSASLTAFEKFSADAVSQTVSEGNAEAHTALQGLEAVPEAISSERAAETPTDTDSPVSAPTTAIPQAPSESEVMAAIASLSHVSPGDSSNASATPGENAIEIPATALGAAFSAVGAVCTGPRWMAEPVTLSDGDSHLILEAEMEKTYAAFAAAENARNAVPEMTGEANAVATELGLARAAAETLPESVQNSAPVETTIQTSEAAPGEFPQIGEVCNTDTVATEAVAGVEVASSVEEISQTVAASTAAVEIQANKPESGTASITETASDTGYREIAYAAAASAGSGSTEMRADVIRQNAELAGQMDTSAAESVAEPISAEAVSESALHVGEEAAPPNIEAAALTSENQDRESQLAAAWQNWRQIRESMVGPQLTSPTASDVSDVGFKDLRQEEKPVTAEAKVEAGPDADQASTIAGIVDSMLAELKPKLMEQIAKKLAEDRK